jgi:predicted metal-binding protein
MYISCTCCGNQFTDKEGRVEDSRLFVCTQCDAERLEAYLEEVREEDEDCV